MRPSPLTGPTTFTLTLTLTVGMSAATALAAPPETRGETRSVTWSPELAGPRPADLQATWKAIWHKDDQFETQRSATGERRWARDCRGLIALPKGFEPVEPTDNDYRIFVARRARCRLIERLITARPAQTDHIGALPMDDSLLDRLPASLIPTPSLDEAATLQRAAARGASWRKRDRGIKVVKKAADEITIESPETRATITWLARGDLDGDGLEDVVLERSGGGQEGTWSSTEFFLLTRRVPNPKAPLTVVARIE
jgi:hypothetical protein